jgi:elongation factor G
MTSLGQALNKLAEDPSIIVHNPETHEVVLWGQGEMHLRRDRTSRCRYGVVLERRQPSVGYRETIRGHVQRGRHKKHQAATANTAMSCSTSSDAARFGLLP